MKHVTDATFEADVIKASETKPVLVDFWATWCGPCRMMAPILDQMDAEYGDKLEITKVDSDANQATAMAYGIQSIPTMNIYRNGKVVKSIVGAMPKPALEQQLAEFLA